MPLSVSFWTNAISAGLAAATTSFAGTACLRSPTLVLNSMPALSSTAAAKGRNASRSPLRASRQICFSFGATVLSNCSSLLLSLRLDRNRPS